MRIVALAFVLLVAPSLSRAEECMPPARCISDQNLQLIVDVLQEKRCLIGTLPRVAVDSVTVIVDREGHVQGTSTKPYEVHLDWCDYHFDVQSQIEVQTSRQVEPRWGFRLRLKAAIGLLGRDLVEGRRFLDSGDVGLMVEPFHFYLATLNGFISFRSIGVGIGHDVTSTFGVALLLNATWDSWRVNPFLAGYFAF